MMHQRDIDLVLIAMVYVCIYFNLKKLIAHNSQIQAMLNKQHNRTFVEKHPHFGKVHYSRSNTSKPIKTKHGLYVGSGLGGFAASFAGGGCNGGGSCDGGGGGSSC